METIFQTYVTPLLVFVGTIVLYYTLKNLLPSYFSEKGKNLATQEDISEITRLVEETKSIFTKETEHLKANLQFLSNLHLGLVLEERNAIVDYNEKYFTWLNALTDSGLGEIDTRDDQQLDSYYKELAKSYNNFINSGTRFGLFVENEELRLLADKVKLVTLENLSSLAPICLQHLKLNNREWEELKRAGQDDKVKERRELSLKLRSEIHDTFRQQMIAGLKSVAVLNKAFQKKCRDYLYELLSK